MYGLFVIARRVASSLVRRVQMTTKHIPILKINRQIATIIPVTIDIQIIAIVITIIITTTITTQTTNHHRATMVIAGTMLPMHQFNTLTRSILRINGKKRTMITMRHSLFADITTNIFWVIAVIYIIKLIIDEQKKIINKKTIFNS